MSDKLTVLACVVLFLTVDYLRARHMRREAEAELMRVVHREDMEWPDARRREPPEIGHLDMRKVYEAIHREAR